MTEDIWVFDVFMGTAEEALALANRINTWPMVWL